MNLQLPSLRGPYATPAKSRSLSDMANEQLRRGLATTQIEQGVIDAKKPDCIGTAKQDDGSIKSPGGGLLALPKLVFDAATGKCK